MFFDKEPEEGAPIVEHVQYFFFNDKGMMRKFEDFARENCEMFDRDQKEQKLEYMEVYKDFQRMFEEAMEEFVESKGSSIEELYTQLRDATETDAEGMNALFAQLMLATADYEVFLSMMYDMKWMKQQERERGERAGEGKAGK